MSEEIKKQEEAVKEPVIKKKKFRVQKSAIKHNGVMFPEGSAIELTDSEAKKLKHLLTPVDK